MVGNQPQRGYNRPLAHVIPAFNLKQGDSIDVQYFRRRRPRPDGLFAHDRDFRFVLVPADPSATEENERTPEDAGRNQQG
ncbi:hypothetical protein D3C78_1627470 [compost metagenome]